MLFEPDNFLYFLTLLTICIAGGTYLLFSYHRNQLLVINAILFYLCSIRAATEYYLPKIDDFSTATTVAIYHSLIGLLLGVLIWVIPWFYIKPFAGHKKERLFNGIYLVVLVGIPTLLVAYGFWNRDVFYFNPEKIEGYWRFTMNIEHPLSKLYLIHTTVFMTLFTTGLLLYALLRDRVYTGRRIFLTFLYITVPITFHGFVLAFQVDNWSVPNVAILYIMNSIVISWFVSNYRIFQSSFEATTTDLLNSISDLAISTDRSFRVANANAQVNQVVEVVKGKSVLETIAANSPFTAPQLQTKITNIIQGQQRNIEIPIIDSNQIKRTFKMNVAPFKKGEKIEGYTFLLTDLSDIRQKEKELEDLNETKDRLFAIIGHDLRKPALAFRGISDKVNFLIEHKEFDTLKKFGAQVEKSAFSLNSLLDNLLNWALQQRDILPYDPTLLTVKEIFTEIQALFHPIAIDKGIALIMKAEAATTIYADTNAVMTILRNLIDNAIKYTPVGGTVEVRSKEIEEGVLITVTDTGTGMKQYTLDTLFQLSKDKSQDGTEGEKGTGLGLNLVKDLVDLNKGRIKVISEWNKGTTFQITLPSEK